MSTQSAKARAQKKVRRQKQFIAVGSVVLLAILGFEMTKLLSHGSGQKAALPVSPATTSSSGAAPAPNSSGWNLPDTDRVVVQRSADQLISFGLFGSKDPFVQQLAVASSPPAAPAAAAPAATRTAVKPSKPLGVGLTPATSATPARSAPAGPPTSAPAPSTAPATTTTSQTTPTAPEAAPTTVLISTNGACEQLSVKGTFPSGEDIFRLVSIARDGKSVEIGVVGGSFDNGQATVTLKLGEKLTLVNTGDGTRYVIELKAKCDVLVQPARTAGASPATTTPSPVPPVPTTTTAPTTTTPIVPDSLDTTTTPTG